MPRQRATIDLPPAVPGFCVGLAGVVGTLLGGVAGALLGLARVDPWNQAAILGSLAGLYGLIAGLAAGSLADLYRLWRHARRPDAVEVTPPASPHSEPGPRRG